jgi:hypothetical protein
VTPQQLYLFNGLYVIILAFIAVLTRATPRRIGGALAGAGADGVVALGTIPLGERAGLWHIAITWEPYYLLLLWIDFTLAGFVFLITGRIARRFGARGLAVTLLLAAALGPVREYRYMARFPEWGAYAPGIAPVLTISLGYILLGVIGHGVMRLAAGPAAKDRLARRPQEPR